MSDLCDFVKPAGQSPFCQIVTFSAVVSWPLSIETTRLAWLESGHPREGRCQNAGAQTVGSPRCRLPVSPAAQPLPRAQRMVLPIRAAHLISRRSPELLATPAGPAADHPGPDASSARHTTPPTPPLTEPHARDAERQTTPPPCEHQTPQHPPAGPAIQAPRSRYQQTGSSAGSIPLSVRISLGNHRMHVSTNRHHAYTAPPLRTTPGPIAIPGRRGRQRPGREVCSRAQPSPKWQRCQHPESRPPALPHEMELPRLDTRGRPHCIRRRQRGSEPFCQLNRQRLQQ